LSFFDIDQVLDAPTPEPLPAPESVAVLACAVFDIEIEALLAEIQTKFGSKPHLTMMEQGLHNDPPRLVKELQRQINLIEQDPKISSIVLLYGLCSRGVDGLTSERCTLVIPRAHDCITVLLGSREHYASYVAEHPGTYWYSPGWNKHHTPPGPDRYNKLRADYVERFGEENADFLMESEQHWFSTYNRASYVHLTVGATDQDKQYTRDCADWLEWSYDEVQGNPQLLRDLLVGRWHDDRFVVVPPKWTLAMTGNEMILRAQAPEDATDE